MRKKLVTLIVAIILANSFVAHAVADVERFNVISPMYTYISVAKATLSINSSGKATVGTEITGNSEVTSIKSKIELQKYKDKGWTTIKTWNESSTSRKLRFSDTYYVSGGYSYRVKSTVTAYSGQNSESTTLTSSTQSY